MPTTRCPASTSSAGGGRAVDAARERDDGERRSGSFTRGRMRYIASVRKGDRLTLDVTGARRRRRRRGRRRRACASTSPARCPASASTAEVEHLLAAPPRRVGRRSAPSSARRPTRVAPACPAYGACGGCALEHLAYAAQLGVEGRRVAAALARGRSRAGRAVRAVAAAARLSQQVEAGLRRRRRRAARSSAPTRRARTAWSISPAAASPSRRSTRSRTALAALARRAPRRAATTSAPREGLLRYVDPARQPRRRGAGHAGHRRRAPWPTAQRSRARSGGAARGRRRGAEHQPARAATCSSATTSAPLDGARARSTSASARCELRLSPTAFFQVNRDMAARLYADVADGRRARPAASAWSTSTAGVGGIALTLARGARARWSASRSIARRRRRRARRRAQLNGAVRTCASSCGDAAARLGRARAPPTWWCSIRRAAAARGGARRGRAPRRRARSST